MFSEQLLLHPSSSGEADAGCVSSEGLSHPPRHAFTVSHTHPSTFPSIPLALLQSENGFKCHRATAITYRHKETQSLSWWRDLWRCEWAHLFLNSVDMKKDCSATTEQSCSSSSKPCLHASPHPHPTPRLSDRILEGPQQRHTRGPTAG